MTDFNSPSIQPHHTGFSVSTKYTSFTNDVYWDNEISLFLCIYICIIYKRVNLVPSPLDLPLNELFNFARISFQQINMFVYWLISPKLSIKYLNCFAIGEILVRQFDAIVYLKLIGVIKWQRICKVVSILFLLWLFIIQIKKALFMELLYFKDCGRM